MFALVVKAAGVLLISFSPMGEVVAEGVHFDTSVLCMGIHVMASEPGSRVLACRAELLLG